MGLLPPQPRGCSRPALSAGGTVLPPCPIIIAAVHPAPPCFSTNQSLAHLVFVPANCAMAAGRQGRWAPPPCP